MMYKGLFDFSFSSFLSSFVSVLPLRHSPSIHAINFVSEH